MGAFLSAEPQRHGGASRWERDNPFDAAVDRCVDTRCPAGEHPKLAQALLAHPSRSGKPRRRGSRGSGPGGHRHPTHTARAFSSSIFDEELAQNRPARISPSARRPGPPPSPQGGRPCCRSQAQGGEGSSPTLEELWRLPDPIRHATRIGIAAGTGSAADRRAPRAGRETFQQRGSAPPRFSSPIARGKETLDARVRRLFSECGLHAPLGDAHADEYTPAADGRNRALVERLDSAVASRVHNVADRERLATALTWFLGFLRDTERVPFVSPDKPGGFGYNQKTLELFAEYIRTNGSRRPGCRGSQLNSDTISAYVSAVKLAASRAQRRPLTSKEENVRYPLQMKSMRKEQAPPGSSHDGVGSQGGGAAGGRALSRALRAHHLRKIANSPCFDRTTREGVQDWGVALMAHNLLLRGGEVGRSSKSKWDPRRGITLESVEPRQPCPESEGCPWMLVRIVAIKDVTGRHAPVYLAIRRHAPFGVVSYLSNPLDPYDAIYAAWLARQAEVPAHMRHAAPLFTSPGGGLMAAWTTDDTRRLARDFGRLVDIDGADIGGKAFRIGGATDMRDAMGDSSVHLIKQRGRWASDIAQVYQRALVRSHLEASVRMGSADAASRDMEELVRGWSQPAICR